VNFCRSPSTTRRSFTRGARTVSVPDPTVTRRSRAWPLRTTSARSSPSRSFPAPVQVRLDLDLQRLGAYLSLVPRYLIVPSEKEQAADAISTARGPAGSLV
jgi:hypothetical protein